MTGRADLVILGNINVDLILGPLDRWPQEGTERVVDQLTWRVGGNAGNAVVACAALGTHFAAVSTVGDDLAGQWLRAHTPAGQVHWIASSGPTSLTVAAAHPNGERTFLTHLGHLRELSWEAVRPWLPAGRVVLLAGAFLTPRLRQQYPTLLAHFAQQGTPVALDFGWPDEGFTGDVRAEVTAWLAQVHHLLINELEAQQLTGTASPDEALSQLTGRVHPQGTVVIKCGARGVIAGTRQGVIRQAAPEVDVIDSVGAGDTWNAAYLHHLLRGAALPEALCRATQVASRAISSQPREYGPG